LVNSVKVICEVADLGKDKYPDVCLGLFLDAEAACTMYASVVTPECRKNLHAFEESMEAAAYGHTAKEYKQLFRHYRFLQRVEALTLAACLVSDFESVDNVVTKLSTIKDFLESTQGSAVWEPTHWEMVWQATSIAYQLAVDTSMALMVARLGQPRHGEAATMTDGILSL